MNEENGELDAIADLEKGWKEQLRLAEEEIDSLKQQVEELTKDLAEARIQIEEMTGEYNRLVTKREELRRRS